MAKTAKSDSSDKESQRIVTPEFRVFYPNVFKPSRMKGTDNALKFSVTGGFDKKKDMSVIKLAIKHAKINFFGPNKEEWPDDIISPVTDGDLPPKPGKKPKEGYKGNWVIKFSSNEDQRPGVVDYPNGDPIVNPSDFYPGCYARAQVFAYVWEFPKDSGRYGVSFILDHVQKMKEGKAIGGKKSAKEAFGITAGGDDEDDVEADDEESTDF